MRLERLNNSHSSIQRRWCSNIGMSKSRYILFQATDPNASTANSQACSFIHSANIETLWCVRQSRLFLIPFFLVLMLLSCLAFCFIPFCIPLNLLLVKDWWFCIPGLLFGKLNHFVTLRLWFFSYEVENCKNPYLMMVGSLNELIHLRTSVGQMVGA